MSRWRPPQEKSTAVITPEGYATLNKELQALWVKRKEVNSALSAAAAEGDRSENAEYIYRKKQQGEIDRKIRYLQKRLPDLKVIDRVANTEQIFFGASIELEKDDGEIVNYRIVGPDETDANKGWISIDSPLAKVLLKKYVDDEVMFKLNGKETNYFVNKITYQF
jgi:transcription elongation factor GreB